MLKLDKLGKSGFVLIYINLKYLLDLGEYYGEKTQFLSVKYNFLYLFKFYFTTLLLLCFIEINSFILLLIRIHFNYKDEIFF